MSSLTSEVHPLLTSKIINILKDRRVFSIYQFLEQDAQVLSKITKLTFKSILIIRKHILNKNAARHRNGLEYYNEILQKTAIISTNHPSLDAILGGGFYTGNIYEICTKSAQHSTSFIYKFILEFLEKHKNNQSVMYYDTKFAFNPMWLKYICDKQFGLGKEDEILNNLLVGQVKDIHELLDHLSELKEQLEQRKSKLRLVVIDSLTAVLYSSIRIEKHNMLLNCLINVMQLMAVEYHICFVITNMLTVEQPADEIGRVYGGKYWQTLPNVRLRILENDEATFEVCIVKNNMGDVNQKCTIVI